MKMFLIRIIATLIFLGAFILLRHLLTFEFAVLLGLATILVDQTIRGTNT